MMTSLPIMPGLAMSRNDHAGNLVTQRQRGRLLGAYAHVEVGQVGMANAATLDLDQNFPGLQLRHRNLGLGQRPRHGHLPGLDGAGNHHVSFIYSSKPVCASP
jgi:hypothetical protein